MKLARRVCVLLLTFLAIACAAPPFRAPAPLPINLDRAITSPDGKATLAWRDGVRVLRLSGSPYEMGYNHGLLLAPEIVNMLVQYGFFVVAEFEFDYDELLARQRLFAWGETGQELTGMLAGLRAALPPEQLRVTPPGKAPREIGLDDLKAMNTMGDWLAGHVSCSSFTVWGRGRQDGSTLLARNFDWLIDPTAQVSKLQLVVARQPAHGPKWINVSFVGEVGCVSGINEHGVSAVIHVSLDGFQPSDREGFVPGTLALRRVIEALGPTSRPIDAERLLDDLPQMGQYLYHVAFPATGRIDDEVAGVFEYDGNARHPDGRATYRRPSDNPQLPHNRFRDQRLEETNVLINVNHYLKRRQLIPLLYSAGRYVTIKRRLRDAMADGNVDVAEARAIMAAVGYEVYQPVWPWITLHTVVFEPQAMMLHLFMAEGERAGYDGRRLDAPFAAFF